MEYGTLSLPIDIPWKRMGVTGSMIDKTPGDLRFPLQWRPSISVFYHEPTEVPPTYTSRKITYLKVVCTITNYAPADDDFLEVLEDLGSRYSGFFISRTFSAQATQSFPCHGALLQVGVYPEPSDGVEPHNFPYISAFQPRKREMYETVTESGEIGSQSSNQVNVGKQMTNTDSTEEYDLDLGYSKSRSGSAGILFNLLEAGGATTTTVNRQVGDVSRAVMEDQYVQSTDTSREKREAYSHATTMNHIYSLLEGYHLGTNRAVFFMQPRPHIQQAKFTFIRGLRALEGIQEFFLIVDRPASVPRICVEVALDTAHMRMERAYRPRFIPQSDLYIAGNLNKTAEALGLDLDLFSDWHRMAEIWNTHSVQIRTEVNKAALNQDNKIHEWAADGFITLEDAGWMLSVLHHLPEIGIEGVALIFEEYEANSGEFFVTGRRLRSCQKQTTPPSLPEPGFVPIPGTVQPSTVNPLVDTELSVAENISSYNDDTTDSIVFEGRFSDIANATSNSIVGTTVARDLNQIVANLNRALRDSVGSTDRAPYGEVPFLETEFMLDELAQFVRLLGKSGIKDKALTDLDGIRYALGKSDRIGGCKYATELGTLTTDMLVRDLKLSRREAKKTRKELLVAAIKALDPATLDPNAAPINPIQERLRAKFPEDRLRKLEKSAGVIEGGPTRPNGRPKAQ